MVTVKLADVLYGFEFSCFDGPFEAMAYVCRETGAVYCTSEDESFESDLPPDLEISDRYVALPSKNDLDLGRSLALSFIEKAAPSDYEAVLGFFRKRGAYAKLKELLERKGLLNQWYEFERASIESALRQWCQENGFEIVT
ncbi:hypothetical protein ACFONG_19380 [Uliginosibacterium paludis]|uniref:DUF4265 domain-containing protein n=1 Tax=Uliginosibacterium paludis TaxID=1615952 RepID=A0ABV2CUC5_9RHOO